MNSQEKEKVNSRPTSDGASQLQKPLGTKLQLPPYLNRPPSALPALSRYSDDSLSLNAPTIQRPSSALKAPTNTSRIINTPTNQPPTTVTKPPVPKPAPSQPTTLQSILTQTNKDIQLGMRVLCLNKHKGKVSYIGKPSFSEGQWYGIALDEPNGKNNGSVQGTSYFECEPNYGLFVRQHQILPLSTPGTNSLPQNGVLQIQLQKTPVVTRGVSQLQQPSRSTPTGDRPPSANSVAPKLAYNIGDRVMVGGKKGTVRYIGRTQFAKGLWTGVELESPDGKNNGSIDGMKYFTCAPKHGLFSPAGKVVAIPASLPGLNTPTQPPVKRTPPSLNSLSSSGSAKQIAIRERPNSRSSSSSLNSTDRTKRADSDMELEGQISGLIDRLEMVSSEKASLEDRLAEEKSTREYLQFSLDEHAVSLDLEGPRTPGILRETKQEVEILHGTIRKLQQGLAKSYAQISNYTSEMEELKESLDRERKYSTQLEKEKETTISSDRETSSSNVEDEEVSREKKDLLASLSERDLALQTQSAVKKELEEIVQRLERELSEKTEQQESLEQEYREARISFENEKRKSLTRVDSVEQQKISLQAELSSLKVALTTATEEVEDKDSKLVTLNRHLSSKDSEIENMRSQIDQAAEEFHIEREDLQAPITELQEKNSRLEKELAKIKCDKRRSDSISADLEKYKRRCEELEQSLKISEEERRKARDTVLKKEEEYYSLQEELTSTQLLLKQKGEENTQQCVMLRELEESNQRKNSRLALMEQNYLQNGELPNQIGDETIEDPLDTQHFRLDDLDLGTTPDESLIDSPTNPWSHQPSRMYCDICEKFDSHETEDCPIQDDNNDSQEEFQTPKLAGYSDRDYCDVCEVFGHSTCDSQETF
ncbi:CAP-Gly domain-containing linker protein 1-like isoform X14 [Oopsacas minuta]|uniref:CAP-Gly domain-containing linker protein 1-like isoform X14 n=1 Tax=Oopsacas minuta TaxID=111878 RepID=A0AAV7KL85_9METZ|nr:CAP-Gly domain-containing linker protein 1-like isoform X14 [Oopsacas minuta]